MSEIRVGVIQFSPSDSLADNLATIREAVTALGPCDLYVLPEYAAWHHPDQRTWHTAGRGIPVDFVGALAEISRESGTTFIAGALVEEDDTVRNRVLVISTPGVIATYDKVHLYDAFGGKESDVIAAGDPAVPPAVVEIAGVRVGVQTCYDLRFPEVSRRLVDAGAEILVVPSDWVPGANKVDHWTTLLRARAIENVAWVVAADHCSPTGIGRSMAVNPLGEVVGDLAEAPGAFAVTVDSASVAEARRTNPALELRRYRVEPR